MTPGAMALNPLKSVISTKSCNRTTGLLYSCPETVKSYPLLNKSSQNLQSWALFGNRAPCWCYSTW